MVDPKKKEVSEKVELQCEINRTTGEISCKVGDEALYEALKKNPPKKFVAVLEESTETKK